MIFKLIILVLIYIVSLLVDKLMNLQSEFREKYNILKELLILTRIQKDYTNSGLVIQMVRQTPIDNFVFFDLEGIEDYENNYQYKRNFV